MALELCGAATAIFVLHYIYVDTFAVGAARTPFQLKYPFTTETVPDAKQLEPFIRALRAQQNQVEQAWAFFLAMWSCALMLDPTFAGACGVVWVAARILPLRFTCTNTYLLFTYTCLPIDASI